MDVQWVILTGQLRALELIGPFATYGEAVNYAEEDTNEDVWNVWDILPVKNPGPYKPHDKEA